MLDHHPGADGDADGGHHEPVAKFEITCSVTLGGDWATTPALVADSIRGLADNLSRRLKLAADDLERDLAVSDPGDDIEIDP